MTVTFRPGLLPPVKAKPRLKLGDYLTGALPTPPAAADWASRVPDWPMYANDQIGDCGPAGGAHIIETVTTYGRGQTVEVSEADVVSFYSEVSGYVPGQPSTDVGVVLQEMLEHWLKSGFAGHEILAFAEVDITNADELALAVDLFGAVLGGFSLPKSAEDQFNAGRPWDVVRGSRILGGHCVPVVAYDKDGLDGATWARLQRMTRRFFNRYASEGWIVITREWANTAGATPTGLDLHALGADFQAMTGQPNPFPDAPPPPAPTPAPADADMAMALAARNWLTQKGL
ncbi:hypothetical protein [Streptomyces sp. NPDC001221]